MEDELDIRYGDGVLRLTMNRPERLNAMTPALGDRLAEELEGATARDDVRVVLLTGAGPAFCSGADLSGADPHQGFDVTSLDRANRIVRAIVGLDKPCVAAVRGVAAGVGCSAALACDLVVAADDAVFGTPEVDVGLWPFMITVPLTRAMPPKVALELMLTGRRVSAEEAQRIGFVNRVVPVDGLDAAVDELAATLAGKPPDAVRLGLASFHEVWGRPADEALRLLHPLLSVLAAGDEAAEGLAAFAEKRPPAWRAEP
jgi:enoyl-CoA hydratase/carnithine racemase